MTHLTAQDYLLIGTPSKVFTDGAVSIRRCKNIFEAIISAQEHPVKKVLVSYSELPDPKPQALEALRHAYPATTICLLVQMTDEPVVRHWLSVCSWPSGIADYIVCPVESASLMPESERLLQDASETAELLRRKDRRIEELETLVMRDDLTGLKNRRYLKHFLPMILKSAQTDQSRVTLLLFDIDDFKHYNDSYGHSVGDDVLRQTAKLIRRCCRNQDIVVRLGGDEFAVVFWEIPEKPEQSGRAVSDRRTSAQEHPREAVFMAERFRSEMHQTSFDLLGPQGKGSLTISGGLSTFPTDAKTAQELFEKADQAMLEAKRSGKNRIYLVGRP